MLYLRYTIIGLIGFLFTSCNSVYSAFSSWTSLILLAVAILGLFVFMFYTIIKRKNQGNKSLAKFSLSIQEMLNKFEHPENRIGALNTLIKRIKEDKQYQKDTVWRDKVLAKTYLHLATEYHHLGDFRAVLDTCTKILKLTPDDAMTLYNRGSLYLNSGEYQKALDDLNKSVELVNNYGSSYNNRGTVFNKLGRYEEALADFDQALALEATAVIYYNKANTLKDLKQIDEALAAYAEAMELCNDEYEEDRMLKKEILSIVGSLSTEA